ncbi:M14 family zinc carboxypeptidase [Photobacterium halotolerans]|uniref:Zinc carboxypeptidase n=1 Tax=Photobacterium halotolerans TaxID=265726 RepID=A0A0F5VDL4_9GAMM|nr:M14 family zinc carboxypeptidase [Photobacterium halotolerans]KKC99569.1 zinc carboxypeptidase [Photobacterium halotolerans]
MTIAERLPELIQLEALIKSEAAIQNRMSLQASELIRLPFHDQHLPIYECRLGNPRPGLPCLFLVGGVHGLERIGTQVLLSLLTSLCRRLAWDNNLKRTLEKMQIVAIPLLNPVGMAMQRRSNARHVDLMRNAPVESTERTAWLVGGHRISPRLPWYRGPAGRPMEAEAQLLVDQVLKQTRQSPFTIALDCHSGFGLRDRIWFPYAKSTLQPVSRLGNLYRIRDMFFQAYPHQNYVFEPQTKHYTCHGDLWDYLYDEAENQGSPLLPLTLEMGSWLWVRKNPLQLWHPLGLFHPMKKHRVQRTLRKHLVLLDFLINATEAYTNWFSHTEDEADWHQAMLLWYSSNRQDNCS